MRHACVAQGPQRPAPRNGLFPQGGGKEAAPLSRGGGAGGNRDDDHSIRDPRRPGHLLQVPWESPIGGRQRLASGGLKSLEVAVVLGTAV